MGAEVDRATFQLQPQSGQGDAAEWFADADVRQAVQPQSGQGGAAESLRAVCPWALHSAVHASAGCRSRTGSQTRQKRRHAIAARRLPQPKNVISTAFPRWSPTSPIGPPYRDPYVGAPLRPWGTIGRQGNPPGCPGGREAPPGKTGGSICTFIRLQRRSRESAELVL